MRRLLLFLLLLLGAVGLGILLHYDNGYAVLSWGAWTVEMSLALLALGLLLAGLVLWLGMRLLLAVLHLPGSLGSRLQARRRRLARESLIGGLVDLAEGRWSEAERRLSRHAEESETPLIHYLLVARAAQLQGADRRRDVYLKNAYEQTPSATVAVLLTQAELQLGHRQYEHALATLRRLQEIKPGHRYGLRLLARAYQALEDWPSLAEILPQLRRQKVFPGEEQEQLERECFFRLIDRHAERRQPEALEKLLGDMPRRLRRDPEVRRSRIRALIAVGEEGRAETEIEQVLRREWDPELVLSYGRLTSGDSGRRLQRAEQWLKAHPNSAELLLCLGRLCTRNQVWGKARRYLEQAIEASPRPDTYEELGRLLDHLGETSAAARAYRHGLELAVRGMPGVEALEAPVVPSPDEGDKVV